MEYAPDVDVVVALDVEDQMRVARQRPGTQTGEIQLVCVAGRAGGRMASDVDVGLLQGFDEAQCSLPGVLAQVVPDSLIDIPVGELTRDDGLGFHPRARRWTRLRSAPK